MQQAAEDRAHGQSFDGKCGQLKDRVDDRQLTANLNPFRIAFDGDRTTVIANDA
jgi:hypothetical protein